MQPVEGRASCGSPEASHVMANSQETPFGSRKYAGLQVLRITAAVMVLFMHSMFFVSERLKPGFHIWGAGATGVDIFFVLSGFVMVYSSTKLLKAPDGWKTFAQRRIIRIVPMYWLATSLKVAIMLLTAGLVMHARGNAAYIISSYLFIPARDGGGEVAPLLGVGWTLYFEMFFYALFTAALFLRVNIYKFVGCILIPLGLGAFLYQPNWPAVCYYLNNTRVFEFFYGMLIARICLTKKHLPVSIALPLMAAGIAGLLAPWPETHQLLGLAHGVSAAALLYATASLEDWLTRIPRVVLYLADASYVIYLFHPLIAPAAPLLLLKLHLVHPWLSVAISVFLGLAAGSLIHSFIEVPVTRGLQKKLRQKQSASAAVSVPVGS
jgi:exopolysaccharide production protein ExoZ